MLFMKTYLPVTTISDRGPMLTWTSLLVGISEKSTVAVGQLKCSLRCSFQRSDRWISEPSGYSLASITPGLRGPFGNSGIFCFSCSSLSAVISQAAGQLKFKGSEISLYVASSLRIYEHPTKQLKSKISMVPGFIWQGILLGSYRCILGTLFRRVVSKLPKVAEVCHCFLE